MPIRYDPLRFAHVEAVRAELINHTARLTWPRERIEQYRDRQLRALLGYAAERSLFHARRLGRLDPSIARVDDLATLPVMTKSQAQESWDSIVTIPDFRRREAEEILAAQQRYTYTPGGFQVFSSGGSSGVRGVYLWDWRFFITAACLAWRTQALADRGHTRPTRLVVLAAGVPPHASTPLFDIPTNDDMQTFVIPAGDPFGDVRAAVADLSPTHLVGYASIIGQLARASLAGELAIRPERVSTNSEPLLDEDRAAIKQAWAATIHNLWGSTEIGVQAVGCGQGEGLHVCEDEVILERVDHDGSPVGHNEPAARTLATGLSNLAFPFIRYDLGDQVDWLPGECPCGSAFRRVADIRGRRDDDFRYGSITLPASVFRHVLGSDAHVSEYQVIQTKAGAEILAVGDRDAEGLETALVAAAQRHGLSNPMVTVRIVDHIPRHDGSGKLRRFVPLRSG